MDLDLTEEQEMLREMVRGVCSSYASLETVRALEDDPVGFPAELWKQMAELDLIGLMVPAEYGGSEMSLLEGAVVYEELGRALAPSPHFVSAVMSAGVLLRAGTDDAEAGVAAAHRRGRRDPHDRRGSSRATASARAACRSRAAADGDEFVLDGVKWHVPFASAATALVVLARTGDADDDVDLFLVDPRARRVDCEQQLTIASDTQYAVTLDGVRVPRVGAHRRRRIRLGDVARHDARRHHPARRAGDRRRPLRARHHRAVRQGPRAVRQAARRVPGDRALPRRRGDDRRRRRDARVRGRVGRARTAGRSTGSRRWRSCSRARRSATSPRWRSRCSAASASPLEYDIQLYFRRAKQLQISWWDDRYLEELVARAVLD